VDINIRQRSYAIIFCNSNGTVGTLDFNGPQMKFEGNADESVDAFVKAFGHWFDERLKQERESEREACAKVCDNYDIRAKTSDGWIILTEAQRVSSELAKKIRARGEV
jgi:hypothetical protein